MPVMIANGPGALRRTTTRHVSQAGVDADAEIDAGWMLVRLDHPDLAMIQGAVDWSRLSVDTGTGRIALAAAPVPTLRESKANAIQAIDANTEAVIVSGFSYLGDVYSLSDRAQRNLMAMRQTHVAGQLDLPRRHPTADNSSMLAVTTSNVGAFLRSTEIPARVAELGARLKAQVIAASTLAEVAAVSDARTGPMVLA